MALENITLGQLQQAFRKADTNGTFRLWANRYIPKKYNLDALTACFVMNALLNF
nr:MAG TPA: Heterocyst differentiation control protein [Caudoviricetes sp.]